VTCSDPGGFSMFRMRETRLGLGALSTPGTTVSTRPRRVRDRRLPHHNGTSLPAQHHTPTQAADLTRHHQGFPVSRPLPSLPLACDPRPVREPLGFPASFTPSRYRPRMSRWGQVTDTTRSHVADITPTSNQRNPLTTCDLTSHPDQSSCRGHEPSSDGHR
jgi:hypothetical protein